MCAGHLLLMYEERIPPGAAIGGQQGAERAATSAKLLQGAVERAAGGHRFRVALPLRCTPGGAAVRDSVVRAEIRLSMCRMCGGACGVPDAIKSHVSVHGASSSAFRVMCRTRVHAYRKDSHAGM